MLRLSQSQAAARTRDQDRRDYLGFTLVEMLLAIGLSTILMVTVLAVIGSIRSVPAASNAAPPQSLHRLISLIESDFRKSHYIRQNKQGLTLYSYNALTPQTHESTHSPVVIQYSIADSDGHAWLVRQQRFAHRTDVENQDWNLMTPLRVGVRRADWELPQRNQGVDSGPDTVQQATPSRNTPEIEKKPEELGLTSDSLASVIYLHLFEESNNNTPTKTLEIIANPLNRPSFHASESNKGEVQ